MEAVVRKALFTIGKELDTGGYPEVSNSGAVIPSDPKVLSTLINEVITNEHDKSRRSTTRTWAGTKRWQRSSNDAGATSKAASFFCDGDFSQFEAEISSIYEAYPDTQVWIQEEGIWLRSRSQILLGLTSSAGFVIFIPYDKQHRPRAWAYWLGAISITWIGPRHTNFPDGSICAFDPIDPGAWKQGEPIVELMDLYSLWVLRHLYLKEYGRWPGLQSIPFGYERLTEQKDDEYCGCNKVQERYVDCCKEEDLARKYLVEALSFTLFTQGANRSPPRQITLFMRDGKHPPSLDDL